MAYKHVFIVALLVLHRTVAKTHDNASNVILNVLNASKTIQQVTSINALPALKHILMPIPQIIHASNHVYLASIFVHKTSAVTVYSLALHVKLPICADHAM